MPSTDDLLTKTIPIIGQDTNNNSLNLISSDIVSLGNSTVSNKVVELSGKIEDKISLLASKTNEVSTFTDKKSAQTTYGQTPDRVNYKTPEELQYQLGLAATYQTLTRPDGSKYEFRHNPDGSYAHGNDGQWIEDPVYNNRTTENLYIDDTVDGNMKLGIARSDINKDALEKGITPFQARYMDKTHYNPYSSNNYKEKGAVVYNSDGTRKVGYDGTPGPKGVTPQNGALMDIELPKNLAEYIEYDTHTNVGQLASRAMGQGGKTPESEAIFGAGQTEYTNPDAPMWNVSYDISKAKIDPTTVLPKYLQLSTGTNAKTTKNYTSEELSKMLKDNDTTRSWEDAFKDTALQVLVGSENLLKNIGDTYGLATGDIDNFVSKTADGASKFYANMYSQELKNMNNEKAKKVAAGVDELDKAWIATKENFSNPALVGQLVTESIPMMVGAMAGGQLIGAAKLGVSAVEGMLSIGAVQQGVDMGQEVYHKFMSRGLDKVPDKYWTENKEYNEYIKSGMDPEEAKHNVALDISRVVAGASGLLSYGVNKFMPGGSAIESKLVGPKSSGISFIKGTVGETATEGLEEGGGKTFQNIGVQQVQPYYETFKDVGQTTADAMVAGGATNISLQGPSAFSNGVGAGKEYVTDKLGNAADVEDTERSRTKAGRRTRFETDPTTVTPESKPAFAKDVLEYASEMWLSPSERAGTQYEKKPTAILDDTVDYMSKMYGVESPEGRSVLEAEVAKHMFDLTNKKEAGIAVMPKSEKDSIVQTLLDKFKGNEQVEYQAEKYYKQQLNEKFQEVRDRLTKEGVNTNDLSKQGLLTQDEFAKLETVLADMRKMGSEELTNTANEISSALVARQERLGSESGDGPKTPVKKTLEDVSREIETLGFLTKNKKSLKDHSSDIASVMNSPIATKEDIDNNVRALEEFVASRKGKIQLFDRKAENTRVRSIGEIRNFTKSTLTDNERIISTINGLIRKSKNEEVNTRLKSMLFQLNDTNAELEKVLNSGSRPEDDVALYKYLFKTQSKVFESDEANLDKYLSEYKQANSSVYPKVETPVEESAPTISTSVQSPKEEKVSNTRSELEYLLDIWSGIDSPKTGGFIKNSTVKDGYKVSDLDEDVKAGEFIKGYSESNLKDLLPTITKPKLNNYKKAVIKYYDEFNRSAPVVKVMRELVELLDKVKSSTEVSDMLGLDTTMETNEPLIPIIPKDKSVPKNEDVVEEIDTESVDRTIKEKSKDLPAISKEDLPMYKSLLDATETLLDEANSILSAGKNIDVKLQEAYTTLDNSNKSINNKSKVSMEDVKLARENAKVLRAEIKKYKAMVESGVRQLFRQDIEEVLGDSVKTNNSTKVGLSNRLFNKATPEELMEIMPNVISKSETGLSKVEDAIDAFATFESDRMPKGGLKRFIDQSMSDSEATELRDIKQYAVLHDTGIDKLFNTPEIEAKVTKAMNVAAAITLDEVISTRELRGEQLINFVEGAFGALWASDYNMRDLILPELGAKVQDGTAVPIATFYRNAGMRFLEELEIKLALDPQEKEDVTRALGALVIDNVYASSAVDIDPDTGARLTVKSGVGLSKEVVRFDKDSLTVTTDAKGYKENTVGIKAINVRGYKFKKELNTIARVFEYAGEKSDGTIGFSPYTQHKVGDLGRNSNTPLTQSEADYLNKVGAMAWTFEGSGIKELLEQSNNSIDALIVNILGPKKDILDNADMMNVESEIAKYEAEELDIRRMMMAYELVGEGEFYMDWDYTISNRAMLSNKMINPQNSKISRFIVSTKDMRTELKGEDLNDTILAMAQAFEMDPDKNKDIDVISKFKKDIADIQYIDGKFTLGTINPKIEAILNANNTLKAIRDNYEKEASSKNIMHIYQAIELIRKIKNGEQATTNLALEIDGITNGMATTVLQMGLISSIGNSKGNTDMAKKAGIYIDGNSKLSNHAQFREDGGDDFYQTPTKALQKAITNNANKKVEELVTELVGANKIGKEKSAWRSFLKPLVMVFAYGAGIRNISKSGSKDLALRMIKAANNDPVKLQEMLDVFRNQDDIDSKYAELIETTGKLKTEKGKYTITKDGMLKFAEDKTGKLRVDNDTLIKMTEVIDLTMSKALPEAFSEEFGVITRYRQTLKVVNQLNYIASVMSFKDKSKGKDYNELTEQEVADINLAMIKDGTYYGAVNPQGGMQDYFNTQVMPNTEGNKVSVKISNTLQNTYLSNNGYVNSINQIVKDLASNVGATGVIDVHSVDGATMIKGNIQDVLNIFDALVMGVGHERNSEQAKAMNDAYYEINMEHSIVGNAINKVLNGKSYEYLSQMNLSKPHEYMDLLTDFNRIYGKNSGDKMTNEEVDSRMFEVVEMLDAIDAGRRELVSTPATSNQYYVSDEYEPGKWTKEQAKKLVDSDTRYAVYSNDSNVSSTEKQKIANLLNSLGELVKLSKEVKKEKYKNVKIYRPATLNKETDKILQQMNECI